MSENVRHKGTVVATTDRSVEVKIVQTAACAACKVASHCHVHDMKEKVVSASCTTLPLPHVGDVVTVAASASTARLSLLLAFGCPLLLMMVVLVGMTMTQQSEGATALAMLGVLVPYYILLWFMRERISRRLTFFIEPK